MNINAKKFALIGGSVMLIMGLFSLIPTLSVYSRSLPNLYVESSYGNFLGIFAMNIFNKALLILMGAAGIACSNTTEIHKNVSASVGWSRAVLYLMALLAVLGIFSKTNTLGGYMPLYGNEIWFHAIFAVLGGYFGYVVHAERSRSGHTTLHRV